MVSRKTIVLFVAFLALLAYVLIFENYFEKKQTAKKEAEEKFYKIDKDNLFQISFLHNGIIIKKENQNWKIISPIQTDADEEEINGFISTFDYLKKKRSLFIRKEEYEKFGLSPYRLAVAFKYSNGVIDTLFFGDKNLDSSLIYCRTKGRKDVSLVSSSLENNITNTLYNWRDKSILKINTTKVFKFKIRTQSDEFLCIKDKTGSWEIRSPITDRCDQNTIQQIFDFLGREQVKEFVDHETKKIEKFGLSHPLLSIELIDSTSQFPKVLNIGRAEKGSYFAKNSLSETIFKVDSSFVNKITVDLFELRDKTIVEFNQDSVFEIKIKYPEYYFHCKKDEEKFWKISSPDTGTAKSWKINALLYDIRYLNASGFIDKPTASESLYGFNQPQIDLVLKSKNAILVNLTIGKETGKHSYIKNKIKNRIYKIKNKDKEKLIVK
ncbi:MAG TPA: DUF4340 domain-containing protein, partial [Candidatus Atribacteria bacterium]|nr:DUF4340 domain-containing protein [Candidatus Atribacteria bacterium]